MNLDIRSLLVFVSLLIGTPAQAQEPIVIKFSHVVAADAPKGRAADFFRLRADDLTKKRVRVEVYPNSTLFKDGDEMQALQRGDVQMLAPSLSKFAALGIREFEVFDIPYLFPDRASLRRVQDGPLGRDLLRRLEPQGAVGLAFWDNGFKVMSANRPLVHPADMRGLKVRIQNSQVLDAQMRTLGATPRATPFSEVFRLLQSGQADGTENPPANMFSIHAHEVQKYTSDTNHGYLGYALIVNKAFWEQLPPDIRAALEQAVREATRYANTMAWQENSDALAVIEHSKKTQVTRLTESQRHVWRQALAPVRETAAKRVGADLVNAIARETGATRP